MSRAIGLTITDFCVCNPFAEKFRAAIKGLNYLDNQKIEAIKKLREVAGDKKQNGFNVSKLRLADAKWAVENWEKWIAFVELNGRLPKDDYLWSGELK